MPHATRQLTLAAALFAAACGKPPSFGAQTPADASPQPRNTPNAVAVDTIVRGLEHPWGMAFLPDGRLLVTEMAGTLHLYDPASKGKGNISGVPDVVRVAQGGLGDVVLHPNFATNSLVYISYVERGEGGLGAVVARARLALDDKGGGALEV